MKKSIKLFNYFTIGEVFLWLASILAIIVCFFLFDRNNYFNLISSFFGVTAILLSAKGNPLGQLLMVGFAVAYSIVAYSYRYYSELITYFFMTLPMSIIALISWLKNRVEGKKYEVKVGELSKKEIPFMILLSLSITFAFYFILRALNTNNLIISTISILTSFLAVYCTCKRASIFSLFYTINDVVLIVLWVLATIDDTSYILMVVCFVTFLFNDMYCYFNWKRLKTSQENLNICQ